MNTSRNPGAAVALAIAAVALVVGVAEASVRYTPSTWVQRDGRFYVNINTTIVEDASLEQPFAASWYSGTLGWNRNLDVAWSNIALGRGGRSLPKHPILLPLLSTPLFWAFGLIGTLIYNLLQFGLFAGAAFAVARRFASPSAAMTAALGVALATSIRDYAYDYHVDVTMLALFTLGVELALSRRGLLAGLLFGATVALRPTMLLFMPFVGVLLAGRRQWRDLGWVLLGGSIAVGLYALSNWWLYGAPWWTGYTRVLVVVDGVPTLSETSNSFDVPLEDGLRALLEGPFGVQHRLPLLAFAAPGVLALLVRRPSAGLATVGAAAAAVFVFAQYRFYGDRFLWPAAAMMVPSLALSFDLLAAGLRRWPDLRRPFVVALGSVAIVAVFASVGPPLEARFGPEPFPHLALCAAGVMALAFGLARLGERVAGKGLGAALPLLVLLLPGVRERVLLADVDLGLAAALALALSSRRAWVGLVWASVAGGAVAYAAPESGAVALHTVAARPALLVGALALLGLPLLGRHAVLLAPLGLLALGPVRGVGGGSLPLFALALLALPALVFVAGASSWVRERWRMASTPRRAGLVALPLVLLFCVGLAPRLRAEPFSMASEAGVRSARVTLGDDIPCDFLAWEHLNWECSTFDRSVHGQVGLVTSQPLTVAGREERLLLVSTTAGRSRTVRWDDVALGQALAMRYAIPDDGRPTGELVLRVAGEVATELDLSSVEPASVHSLRVDTSSHAGERAAIELELRGAGAMLGVDAHVEPAP